MIFVDSHSHLNDSRLIHRIPEILELCAQRSVKYINVVGYDPKTNLAAIDVVKNYGSNPWNVRLDFSLGFHPTMVLRPGVEENFQVFTEQARQHSQNLLFIGEVGLDYYWVKESELRKLQLRLLERILDLAEGLKKPLMIHCRNAWKDMIAFLREHAPSVPVIFHSYSGSKGDTRNLLSLDLELYFSIATSIVRNTSYLNVVKLIPLERLLFETDAPYLSPVKGELNVPCNVVQAYRAVAEGLSLELETLASKVLQSYLRLAKESHGAGV